MRSAICRATLAFAVLLTTIGVAWSVTLEDVAEDIANAALVEGTSKPVGPLKGRIVVVTFFASWCPPCRNEFDHLNHLVKQSKDNRVTVVGINLFEAWGGKKNPARMARFLADTKPLFAVIEGSEALRMGFGNVERIPSVFVIGKDGRETWRFVHERGSSKTHTTIEDLTQALSAAGAVFASQ